MAKVEILSGLPGSGKSHYAKKRIEALPVGAKSAVVSADDYFIGSDGEYRYDPSKIGDAHAWCMGEFLYEQAKYQWREPDLIIVDNTNTSPIEIAPYMLVAASFALSTKVVRFMTESEEDFQLCLQRQTHGVPEKTMRKMQEALTTPLPLWWQWEGRSIQR